MRMTRRAYERDLEERIYAYCNTLQYIAQVNDAPQQLRSKYDAQNKIGLKSNLVMTGHTKMFLEPTKKLLEFYIG